MSHISRSDGFYIVLPSNVRSSYENNPSEYHTELMNTVNLDTPGDQWEVGLVEISFTNSIKTIDKEEKIHICQAFEERTSDHRYFFKGKIDVRTSSPNLNLEDDFYNFNSKTALNDVVTHPDFHLEWVDAEKKFSITILNPKVTSIEMDPYTAFVLGFVDNRVLDRNESYYQKSSNVEPQKILYNGGKATMAKSIARAVPHKSKRNGEDLTASLILNYHDDLHNDSLTFYVTTRVTTLQSKILESISIPEGYYSTTQALVDSVNAALKHHEDFSFTYDAYNNRIIFKMKEVSLETSFLRLDPALGDVFGFSPKQLDLKKAVVEAAYPPDLRRGITSLYVYCDLCLETYVGDSLVPLLRTVSFNSGIAFGQTITVLYDNPIYVPLNKHTINSIEMKICDHAGSRVPLIEGTTVVTLHFRRHTL